jgi:hypothetical protein
LSGKRTERQYNCDGGECQHQHEKRHPPSSKGDLHWLSARRPPPKLQNSLVQPGLQSQNSECDE